MTGRPMNRANSGFFFDLIYDLGRARLGRGGPVGGSNRGCPRHRGVTLIWHAPAGRRGGEWLKSASVCQAVFAVRRS
jgi:hypothetical protein